MLFSWVYAVMLGETIGITKPLLLISVLVRIFPLQCLPCSQPRRDSAIFWSLSLACVLISLFDCSVSVCGYVVNWYMKTGSLHGVEAFRKDKRNQRKSFGLGNLEFLVCISLSAVGRKQEILAHFPGCSTDLGMCVGRSWNTFTLDPSHRYQAWKLGNKVIWE